MSKPTVRELLDEARDSDWSVTRTLAARVERVLALHALEPEWRDDEEMARGTQRRCMCGCEWIDGCTSSTVRILNGEEK